MDDDRRIASRKGARNSWKRMSNRRRTITNQLVRRRNPTPHEFPPGWTIKSERVCPTYLETNGETWINNVFDSPTLLSSPSIYPFFLFQEDTSTIPRYEPRGMDVVTRCLGSNSTYGGLCLLSSWLFEESNRKGYGWILGRSIIAIEILPTIIFYLFNAWKLSISRFRIDKIFTFLAYFTIQRIVMFYFNAFE